MRQQPDPHPALSLSPLTFSNIAKVGYEDEESFRIASFTLQPNLMVSHRRGSHHHWFTHSLKTRTFICIADKQCHSFPHGLVESKDVIPPHLMHLHHHNYRELEDATKEAEAAAVPDPHTGHN